MHELPDGSGFFVASIGPRDPGFINWLKARPNGSCRTWLYFWRNYRSAREISRYPDQGPPMGHWRSLRYSASVSL